MRSRRLFIVMALALLSGLAAAWLALNYLRQPESPIRTVEPASTEVVVAARDLSLGTVLTAEDVKLASWPGGLLPEGYTTSVEEVLGRGVITDVVLNEPLISRKMAVKEAGGGLPIVIPEGMRAVSVRVDDVISIAGFVLPGTRVDVMVTLDQGSQQNNPVTKIILQNIPILTSGQVVDHDVNGEPIQVTVITLMVTPEQAEELVLAATRGRIQLALRNTLDIDSVTTEGARLNELIPAQRQVVRSSAPRRATPPAAAPTRQIEVWRGNQVETETLDEGGS
ncbi:MAG: Flp pilus assembly protein CpaB [Candidatus Palauibacterales bacterium]|nr:Flp pilus assembly protein CpaB [Candidatus Palauibacterales bacterium]MDP2482251.1 Flp pilus assembly protein CpaB [Candidatus Palauibacterales bacterium]